eukprot:6675297-Pyramimonas_sp.AAC.1
MGPARKDSEAYQLFNAQFSDSAAASEAAGFLSASNAVKATAPPTLRTEVRAVLPPPVSSEAPPP